MDSNLDKDIYEAIMVWSKYGLTKGKRLFKKVYLKYFLNSSIEDKLRILSHMENVSKEENNQNSINFYKRKMEEIIMERPVINNELKNIQGENTLQICKEIGKSLEKLKTLNFYHFDKIKELESELIEKHNSIEVLKHADKDNKEEIDRVYGDINAINEALEYHKEQLEYILRVNNSDFNGMNINLTHLINIFSGVDGKYYEDNKIRYAR